jgi:hypothetical protein
VRLVVERLQRQDLDQAPDPPTAFRRFPEALEECQCLAKRALRPVDPVPRHEHPRQRDVLELAQVTEVIVDRQALLVGPTQGFGKPALADPHPRSRGRYRTHIGSGAPDIQTLRFAEQVERGVQVASSPLVCAMATCHRCRCSDVPPQSLSVSLLCR